MSANPDGAPPVVETAWQRVTRVSSGLRSLRPWAHKWFQPSLIVLLLAFLVPTLWSPAEQWLMEHTYGGGTILIDSPEVNTRERLVNDRFMQDAWLRGQLRLLDEDQGGPYVRGIVRETSRTDVVVESTTEAKTGESASEKDRSDSALTPPSRRQTGGTDSPVRIGPDPIAQFHSRLEYRNAIREELLENQLDDRHDRYGNTLVRLKFDATVLPDKSANVWSLVVAELSPFDGTGAIAGELSVHCDEVGKGKKPLVKKEECVDVYEDIYHEWIDLTRKRIELSARLAIASVATRPGDFPSALLQSLHERGVAKLVARERRRGVAAGVPESRDARRKSIAEAIETIASELEREVREQCDRTGEQRADSEIDECTRRTAPIAVQRKWLEELKRCGGQTDCVRKVHSLSAMRSLPLPCKKPTPVEKKEQIRSCIADSASLEQLRVKAIEKLLANLANPKRALRKGCNGGDHFDGTWELDGLRRSVKADLDPKKTANASNVLTESRALSQLVAEVQCRAFEDESALKEFASFGVVGCEEGGCRVGVFSKDNKQPSSAVAAFVAPQGHGPPPTAFVRKLKERELVYSYAVSPKHPVDRLMLDRAREESLRGSIDLASKILARSDLSAEIQNAHASSGVVEAPLVMGFGQTELEQFLPSEEDPPPSSSRFGWLLGPQLVPHKGGDTRAHSARQVALAAVVSVPSWWKRARVDVKTCWGIDPEDVPECDTAFTAYIIDLPGTAQGVSRAFDFVVPKEPLVHTLINRSRQQLTAGQRGSLLIEGERLWRSTVVSLGSQLADRITVMPNMGAIVAEFNCVQQPSFLAERQDPQREKTPENKPKYVLVPVSVWTSEGYAPGNDAKIVISEKRRCRDEIDAIEVGSGKKEDPADGESQGETDKTKGGGSKARDASSNAGEAGHASRRKHGE